jgi:hypothetical protein
VTSADPVRDRAVRLRSEVRRLEAGAQGEGQAKRVAQRVDEIQSALSILSGHARAARALRRLTAAADVSLAGLGAGRDDLARRAAGSIPSDSAFTAAKRKIEATSSGLAKEIQAAWKPWADEQLSALPDRRIAMLDPARQAQARVTLRSLRSLAAAASVTTPVINDFTSAYEGLAEELADAADVPEELLAVLDRLARNSATLRDISDDEVALLRAHQMDADIELRRKSA